MLYIKYSTLCNAGHRSSWRGRGNGKGGGCWRGKRGGLVMLPASLHLFRKRGG